MTDLPNPGCVIKVGEGRGFVINYRTRVPKYRGLKTVPFLKHRLVVTAAHLLPWTPSCTGNAGDYQQRTYARLLGTRDSRKNLRVSAECLFVDPVADVAVLGSPDDVEIENEASAYHSLTKGAPFLRIAKAESGSGWVLSLDGHWIRTALQILTTMGGTVLSIGPTKAGMSGSPILDDAGRAIGVVSASTPEQPMLVRNLPGWLLPVR